MAVIVAAACLMWSVSPARAWRSQEAGRRAHLPVSLNRSVSLEPTAEPPKPRGEVTPGRSAETARQPVDSARSSRRSLGPRRGRGLTAVLPDESPWYASGLGALAVVLVLIGSGTWAVKRWIPAARRADHRLLRVVARTGLSPKHSMNLVRVGRRFVIVGVSGDRMTALADITDPDEVAELVERIDASPAATPTGFDDLLRSETGHYLDVAPDVAAHPSRLADGLRRGREPLSKLLRRLRSLQLK